MATANPLDELRRRIGHGAAPGAFAALAEEHRRAGRFDDAIVVCREGLERYPTYVSARVTLGRALLDMGDVETALGELTLAVEQAPDNLAAARALEAARALMPSSTPSEGLAPQDRESDGESEGNEPAAIEVIAVPSSTGGGGETAPLAWLFQPEARGDDYAFVSESSVAGGTADAVTADHAADPSADANGHAAEAWDETTYTPVVAVAPTATLHEPLDSVVYLDETSARQDIDTAVLGDWGAAALAPPAVAAEPTWGPSVEAAVAEVFARAAGELDEVAPAPDTVADEPASLEALQSLLASIRARRAALGAAHTGVD